MNQKQKTVLPFPQDLGVRLVDIIRDPELIVKKIQQKVGLAKVRCLVCHELLSFKFSQKYYSFRCKCRMNIFYPQRSDRNYDFGYRWIDKKDYKEGFSNGNDRKIGKDARRKT